MISLDFLGFLSFGAPKRGPKFKAIQHSDWHIWVVKKGRIRKSRVDPYRSNVSYGFPRFCDD